MIEKTKILVVDDEVVVQRSYHRILAGDHCQVETAMNGQDALQMMAQGPFDVVLLDLRMPGLDGMSTLRGIKEKWPESEVIIITGYPALESAKQAVTLGAYDYLAKPAGPEDILNVANRALLHKRWLMHCDAGPPCEGHEQEVRQQGIE